MDQSAAPFLIVQHSGGYIIMKVLATLAIWGRAYIWLRKPSEGILRALAVVAVFFSTLLAAIFVYIFYLEHKYSIPRIEFYESGFCDIAITHPTTFYNYSRIINVERYSSPKSVHPEAQGGRSDRFTGFRFDLKDCKGSDCKIYVDGLNMYAIETIVQKRVTMAANLAKPLPDRDCRNNSPPKSSSDVTP